MTYTHNPDHRLDRRPAHLDPSVKQTRQTGPPSS